MPLSEINVLAMLVASAMSFAIERLQCGLLVRGVLGAWS
jgi:hypothetical protein